MTVSPASVDPAGPVATVAFPFVVTEWSGMKNRLIPGALIVALLAGGAVAVSTPAEAAAATKYKNCAALNKKYKHGVARKGAKDKVRGSTKPVTTFTVNTKVYNANKKKLDRDKDGIACEKR